MPDYKNLTREEAIEMCKTLWLKNAALEKKCELYKEQLAKNKAKMYGKCSEKSTLVMHGELDLFDEADALAEEDEKEETPNIAKY